MKQLQPSGVRTYLRPGPTPKMPPGLEELMEGMTREVLRHNPSNIYEFCSKHMENLIHIKDSHMKSSRPTNKVVLENKIKKAQNKINERALQRRIMNEENDKDNGFKTMAINKSKDVVDDNIRTINDTELFATDKGNEEKSETSTINEYSKIESIVHAKDYENNEVKEPSDLTTKNNEYIYSQMKVSSVVERNKIEKENIKAFITTSTNNEPEKQQEHENECFDQSILNSVTKIGDDVDLNNGDIKKIMASVDTKQVAPLNVIDLPINAFKSNQETIVKQDLSEIAPCENLNTSTEKPIEIKDLSNNNKNDVRSCNNDTENINIDLKRDSLNHSIVKFENIKMPAEKLSGINEKNDEKKSDTNVDPNKEQINDNEANTLKNTQETIVKKDLSEIAPCNNLNTSTEKAIEINDLSNNNKNDVKSCNNDSENLNTDLKKDSLDSIVKLENIKMPSEKLTGINEKNDEKKSDTNVDPNKEQINYNSAKDLTSDNINILANVIMSAENHTGFNEFSSINKYTEDKSNPVGVKIEENIGNLEKDLLREKNDNLEVISQNIVDKTEEKSDSLGNPKTEENIEHLEKDYLSDNIDNLEVISQNIGNKINENAINNKLFNESKDIAINDDNARLLESNIRREDENNFKELIKLNINVPSQHIKNIPVDEIFKDVQANQLSGNDIIADKTIVEQLHCKDNNLKIIKTDEDNSLETKSDLINLKEDYVELKQNYLDDSDDIERNDANINKNKSLIQESQTSTLGGEKDHCIPDVIYAVDNKLTKEEIKKSGSININESIDITNNELKQIITKSKDDNTKEVTNSSIGNIRPIDAVNIDDQSDTVNTSVSREYKNGNSKDEFATDLHIKDDSKERNNTSNDKSKDDNPMEVTNSSIDNVSPIDAVNIDDQNYVNTSVSREDKKENIKKESFATDLQINDDSEEHNKTESKVFDSENRSIVADGVNDLNSASIADNSMSDDNNLKKQPSMDLETAAITIQKVFRSFMFKSRASTLDEIPNYDESNDIPYMPLENEITCNNQEFITPNIDRRTLGISRMDTVLQTVNEEKSLSVSTDDSSTLSSAATTIQAHVRGFLVRNRLNSNKTNSNSSMMNSDGLSMDIDNEVQKNKTILNIHIVPEGGQFVSRDDSIGNAGDLSFDVSPRSSNLHPLGYDRNERRKQLKREDAIQSVSPPSNNSGKLSEDVESVKDLTNNETAPEIESTVQLFGKSLEVINVKDEDDSSGTSPSRSTTANTVIEVINNENVENRRERLTKMSSDEMDVVTPNKNNGDTLSIRSQSSQLLHSGEFHDMVLPTRVSRTESSVVREFQNAWVYFLRWNG